MILGNFDTIEDGKKHFYLRDKNNEDKTLLYLSEDLLKAFGMPEGLKNGEELSKFLMGFGYFLAKNSMKPAQPSEDEFKSGVEERKE